MIKTAFVQTPFLSVIKLKPKLDSGFFEIGRKGFGSEKSGSRYDTYCYIGESEGVI